MEGFLDKVRCDSEHQTEKMFSHRQPCLKEFCLYILKNSILLCQPLVQVIFQNAVVYSLNRAVIFSLGK